jgi:hypothetical protein
MVHFSDASGQPQTPQGANRTSAGGGRGPFHRSHGPSRASGQRLTTGARGLSDAVPGRPASGRVRRPFPAFSTARVKAKAIISNGRGVPADPPRVPPPVATRARVQDLGRQSARPGDAVPLCLACAYHGWRSWYLFRCQVSCGMTSAAIHSIVFSTCSAAIGSHTVQVVSPASAKCPRSSMTLAAVGAAPPSGRPGDGTAAGMPGGVRNAAEARVRRSALPVSSASSCRRRLTSVSSAALTPVPYQPSPKRSVRRRAASL